MISIAISRDAPPKNAKPKLEKGEWRIVRKFDDGLVELEGHKGRRWRGRPQICPSCSSAVLAVNVTFAGVCEPCATAREEKRTDDLKKRRMLMLEQGETSPQRRAAIFILASPKWRNKKAISAKYAEARRVTKETGIEHDVDHIYPLQAAMGCGLHVHWNLQVMPASQNRSKANGFPLEQSPAWDGCSLEEIEREFRIMLNEYRLSLDTGRKINANQAASKFAPASGN